uniref:SAM domain-containing protein n=1 Tax=Strongyloides papillosus TaxID=174720 RepID=A0A0N5BAD7_STREA
MYIWGVYIWIKDGFLLKPYPIGLPWREGKEIIDIDKEMNGITARNINNSKNRPNFLSLAQKNCFEYGYLNNAFKTYQDSRKTSVNSIISTDFGRKRDEIFMRSKDNSNNSLLKNMCKKSNEESRSNHSIRYSFYKDPFSKSNNILFDNKKNFNSYSGLPTQVNTDNSYFEDSYNHQRFPSTGQLNSQSQMTTNQIIQSPSLTNNLLDEQILSSNINSSKTNVNTFSSTRKNSKRNVPYMFNLNSSTTDNSSTGINSENIKQIFSENNLEKFIEKIDEQEVDMEIFLTLNRQDLINVFEINTKTEDNIHLATMLNLIKYYKNLYNIA